jgi:competence ComEA-like helix-hairpin-helix protein
MSNYSSPQVSNMMRHICGNDPPPRQGGIRVLRAFPTLRIGLMFRAPAEPRSLTRYTVLLVVISLSAMMACTSRVEYLASNTAQPAQYAININTATVDELQHIPHIGLKTAETIVGFRTENGPFRRPEHLMQIRGISEKRFAEIRQFIRTE